MAIASAKKEIMNIQINPKFAMLSPVAFRVVVVVFRVVVVDLLPIIGGLVGLGVADGAFGLTCGSPVGLSPPPVPGASVMF